MKKIKKTLASLLVGVASFGLANRVNGQAIGNLYAASNGPYLVDEFHDDGKQCNFVHTFFNLEGGSAEPRNITFSPLNNNLIVAQSGQYRAVEYDGEVGTFIRSYEVPTSPYGLDYGQDNNLYITSGGTSGIGEVYKFDGLTGMPLGVFIPDSNYGLGYPSTLKFGLDTYLYVGNYTGGVFKHNGTTGEILLPTPFTSGGPVSDFSFGPNGDLFVAGGSVREYSGINGDLIGEFIGNVQARGLTFGPNGDLYLSNLTAEIMVYNNTGEYLYSCQGPPNMQRQYYGMAFKLPIMCGNGILDQNEECDDGNNITEPCEYGLQSCIVCDSECNLVAGSLTGYCSDGIMNGPEECDDGNLNDDDGCTLECRIEQVRDWDNDGDVDLDDYLPFSVCIQYSGPNDPPLFQECLFFDYDSDNDIDLKDFSRFQKQYTG